MSNEVKTSGNLSPLDLLKRSGPGIIMAAAAVGTGTVATSANLGATYGYAMVWMVILAMVMRGIYVRATYVSTAVLKMPVIDSIRAYYGKGLSIFCGFICAFGCIAYECGNFSGTGMSLSLLLPIDWKIGGIIMSLFCVFLMFSKNVYNKVEKFMKACVFIMILGFLTALIMTGGPSATGFAKGIVPSLPDQSALFTALAFIGSCAAISGVVYGSHLSKDKGWTVEDIKNKTILGDTIIGVGSIAVIVLLVLCTAAVTLNPRGITIGGISDLTEMLIPLLGTGAKYLIGICLLAASTSSMLASATMGATLLLAGFGKESKMDDMNTKIWGTVVIALGAVIAFIFGSAPMQMIFVSNICAVLNAPILAILIIMIVNRKEMGEYKYTVKGNIALALCLLGLLAVTAYNIARYTGMI